MKTTPNMVTRGSNEQPGNPAPRLGLDIASLLDALDALDRVTEKTPSSESSPRSYRSNGHDGLTDIESDNEMWGLGVSSNEPLAPRASETGEHATTELAAYSSKVVRNSHCSA